LHVSLALRGVGDWVGSIDRPHFEVKVSWKIPAGCKLEGRLNVPTNSKGQVQLIAEDKPKEEIKVSQTWNPGSPAMKTETGNFIAQAVKDGII